jgi:hypothetical protein
MLKNNCAHPQYAVVDKGSGTNIYSEVLRRSECSLCGCIGLYNPRIGQQWIHPHNIPARPADWKFRKVPYAAINNEGRPRLPDA